MHHKYINRVPNPWHFDLNPVRLHFPTPLTCSKMGEFKNFVKSSCTASSMNNEPKYSSVSKMWSFLLIKQYVGAGQFGLFFQRWFIFDPKTYRKESFNPSLSKFKTFARVRSVSSRFLAFPIGNNTYMELSLCFPGSVYIGVFLAPTRHPYGHILLFSDTREATWKRSTLLYCKILPTVYPEWLDTTM